MRDEMDARLWNQHHERFSADMATFLKRLADAMRLLNAIQWAAPWRRQRSGC
jgi:hypothetical protein